MSHRSLALAAALGVAGWSSPVAASPWAIAAPAEASEGAEVNPEAIQAFEEGSNAYALGNYEEAVGHFERAFELSHRSELLFNIGQAYSRWYEISEDPGHLKKARKLLQNYITFLDDAEDADPEARRQAEERLEHVEQELAALDAGDETQPVDEKKPVHKKAWFWVVIVGGAAVVAGAVTTGVLLSRRNQGGFDPELGTIGRDRLPGGLTLRF